MKLDGISFVKLIQSSQDNQQVDGGLSLLGNNSSILPNDTGQDTVLILQQMNDDMFVQLWPAVTFLALIMAAGVLGNLTVCYIFAFKLRGSTQNFLLLSIGIFDLLSCSLGIPGEIFDMKRYYYFKSVKACKIMRFITSFPTMASILVLLIIAADRYRKVCEPLHGQIEPLHAKWAMVGVVIIALAFSFPALNIYGARSFQTPVPGLVGQECSISDLQTGGTYPLVYEVTLCVAFVISATALIVIYFRVLFETRRHRRYLKMHAVPSFAKQSMSTSTREAEALLNSSISKADDVVSSVEVRRSGKNKPPSVVASDERFAGDNNAGKDNGVNFSRSKIKTFFINLKGKDNSKKTDQRVSHKMNSIEADSGDIVIFRQGSSLRDRNSLLNLQNKGNENGANGIPVDLIKKDLSQNASCKCNSFCGNRDLTVGPAKSNDLFNSSTQIVFPVEPCKTTQVDVSNESLQSDGGQKHTDSCTLRITDEHGRIVTESSIEMDSLAGEENNRDRNIDNERRQSFPMNTPGSEDSRALKFASQRTCNRKILSLSHPDFSCHDTSEIELKPVVSTTVANVEVNGLEDSSVDMSVTSDPVMAVDTANAYTTCSNNAFCVHSETKTSNLHTNRVDTIKENDLSKSLSSAASSGSESSLPSKSTMAAGHSSALSKSFPLRPHSLANLPKSQSNQSLLWNSIKTFQTNKQNQSNDENSLQEPKLRHSSSSTVLHNRSTSQSNTLTPLHKSKSTQSLGLMRVRKALRPTRMTVIACVITSAFIVSYLPHLSLVIMRSVFVDFEHQLEEPWLNLYNIFLRSYFVNNVINFFVYGTMSREFREEVKKMWQNLKHMRWLNTKCRCTGS